jgi:hypothetical protein
VGEDRGEHPKEQSASHMICADVAQGAARGSNGSVCEEDRCVGCDAVYLAGGGTVGSAELSV